MFTDFEEIGFDQVAVKIPIREMHLDKGVIQEMAQKKEQVLERQAEQRTENVDTNKNA